MPPRHRKLNPGVVDPDLHLEGYGAGWPGSYVTAKHHTSQLQLALDYHRGTYKACLSDIIVGRPSIITIQYVKVVIVVIGRWVRPRLTCLGCNHTLMCGKDADREAGKDLSYRIPPLPSAIHVNTLHMSLNSALPRDAHCRPLSAMPYPNC